MQRDIEKYESKLVGLPTTVDDSQAEVKSVDPKARFSKIREISELKQTWIPFPGDIIMNTETGEEFFVMSVGEGEVIRARGIILLNDRNSRLNEVISILRTELYGAGRTYSLIGALDFNSDVREEGDDYSSRLKKNFFKRKAALVNDKIMRSKPDVVVSKLVSLPLTLEKAHAGVKSRFSKSQSSETTKPKKEKGGEISEKKKS